MGYSNSCPDTSTPASRMSRTDVPSRLDHIIHHKDLDSGLCCLTDLIALIGLVGPISLIGLIDLVGLVRVQFFVPKESVAA